MAAVFAFAFRLVHSNMIDQFPDQRCGQFVHLHKAPNSGNEMPVILFLTSHIIIPATMQIYRDCIEKGYITAFIDAGAVVSTPTCGPCLGGYMGILAAGERCVATTNRNFDGRMGHVDSEVYLASPQTAAASAIAGCITESKEV